MEVKAIGETFKFATAIVTVCINDRKTMGHKSNTAPPTKRAAGNHSGSRRIFMVRALPVRRGQSAASCAQTETCSAESSTPPNGRTVLLARTTRYDFTSLCVGR